MQVVRTGLGPSRSRIAAMFLSLTFAASLATAEAAPDRNPINLVTILDVSTSMRGTFRQMQDYVYGSVVGKLLRSGDYLCLFTFGVQAKKVFAATIELPRDGERLKDLVYAMSPSENGTDIGLMLEKLDELLKSKPFPNARTSIVWATDGKNDPPAGSRYLGKNVFDPKAFAAYTILKSSAYKVLLLSIGADTAAKELSGPMGGEYLEVGRDVTASKLETIMGDFTSSIDLSAPSAAQRVSSRNPKVRFGLESSFSEPRDLTIEKVLVAVDGGPWAESATPGMKLRIPPKSRVELDISLPLPEGLAAGEHSAEVELRASGGERLGPAQRVAFSYSAGANPVETGIVLVLVLISIGCILVGAARSV